MPDLEHTKYFTFPLKLGEAELERERRVLRMRQEFGKKINRMGIRRNICNFQEAILNLFTSEVIVDKKVFGAVMKTEIGGEKLSGFIITEKGDQKRNMYF